MRGIYLITMKGTNLYKVGYTKNMEVRRIAYITCNPLYRELQFCETYAKSKHTLEKTAQAQIRQLGGQYITNFGIKTEWFEFNGNFNLEMLECCKTRKIHKL